MGPPGDCPCIRRSKGLPVPIAETYVAPEVWDFLTEEEQKTINELKLRPAMRYIFAKKEAPNDSQATS